MQHFLNVSRIRSLYITLFDSTQDHTAHIKEEVYVYVLVKILY